MKKCRLLIAALAVCLSAIGFVSCDETKYILSPEVAINVPESGLSVELGGTLEITADVKNTDASTTYQWEVNGIKVSTSPTLVFEAKEPGNNSVSLTVTNENGSSSDAATVLVARSSIEAAISVLDNKNTTVEYLDSLVLRGTVYSRDEYEVEWSIDGERVSKEFYYVFKAMKEGVHTITFKALSINGKYSSDDIDITVTVPQLAAVIEKPAYGFRTPVGEKLLLHGETNRVNDVTYEWIVDGKTVCTEQDYEFPAANLDLVDVTLKVTDPTQTASTTETVEVHSPMKYGTLLFTAKDIHFVDYAGRLYLNKFSEMNPWNAEAVESYDWDKMIQFNSDVTKVGNYLYNCSSSMGYTSGNKRLEQRYSIIDAKTLTHQRDFTVVFNGSSSISPRIAFFNGKMYATGSNKISEEETQSGLFEVNTTTGELTFLCELPSISIAAFIVENNYFYLFTGSYVYKVDPTTWTIVDTATQMDGSYPNLSRTNSWVVMNGLLFKGGSERSMTIHDFSTNRRSSLKITRNTSRAGYNLLATSNNTLYGISNYFIGKLDNETYTFTTIADLNPENEFSGCQLTEDLGIFFITPDGQAIVVGKAQSGGYSKIKVFDVNNPDKPQCFERLDNTVIQKCIFLN